MDYNQSLISKKAQEGIWDAKSHLASQEYQKRLLHTFLVEKRFGEKMMKYASYRHKFLLLCRQKWREDLYNKRRNKSLNNLPYFGLMPDNKYTKNLRGNYSTFLNCIDVSTKLSGQNAKSTGFHEMLHAGGVSTRMLSDLEKHKALQLVCYDAVDKLHYDNSIKKELKSYYFKPEEIIANYKTIAYIEGIKPFSPYPGNEKVISMIVRIRKLQDGEIMRLLPDLSPRTLRKVRNALSCRSF